MEARSLPFPVYGALGRPSDISPCDLLSCCFHTFCAGQGRVFLVSYHELLITSHLSIVSSRFPCRASIAADGGGALYLPWHALAGISATYLLPTISSHNNATIRGRTRDSRLLYLTGLPPPRQILVNLTGGLRPSAAPP